MEHEQGDGAAGMIGDRTLTHLMFSIQCFGSTLCLTAVLTMDRFTNMADLLDGKYPTYVKAGALTMLCLSLVVWLSWGRLGGTRPTGMLRSLVILDVLFLAALLCLTGGVRDSLFAPLFFAALPMILLVERDLTPKVGLLLLFALAFIVTLVFDLRGFQYGMDVGGRDDRRMWLCLFTVFFVLFPAVFDVLATIADSRVGTRRLGPSAHSVTRRSVGARSGSRRQLLIRYRRLATRSERLLRTDDAPKHSGNTRDRDGSRRGVPVPPGDRSA